MPLQSQHSTRSGLRRALLLLLIEASIVPPLLRAGALTLAFAPSSRQRYDPARRVRRHHRYRLVKPGADERQPVVAPTRGKRLLTSDGLRRARNVRKRLGVGVLTLALATSVPAQKLPTFNPSPVHARDDEAACALACRPWREQRRSRRRRRHDSRPRPARRRVKRVRAFGTEFSPVDSNETWLWRNQNG